MWNQNEMTKILGVQYPIIQAGMAGSTTPHLVSTVSERGGLGTIGAGYFNAEKLESEIQEVQRLTDKPFGVNLFVPSINRYLPDQIEHMNAWLKPYRRAFNLEEPVVNVTEEKQFKQAIDLIIKYHVPVCCFTFGIPDEETIQKLKEANVTLVGTATSVDEAIENERSGMDIIVAQGSEAGGHRGSFLNHSDEEPMIGTMSLVPQVVDNVSIPVVAAGGIMDGRGLLASMMLGAQGVQMGTAFLISDESAASDLLKNAILGSKETDTVVTKVFSGKFARGIHNEFIHEMNQYDGEIPDYPIQNQLTNSIRKAAAQNGSRELTHMWSGQSPRLAERMHASIVMDKVISQVEKKLQLI